MMIAQFTISHVKIKGSKPSTKYNLGYIITIGKAIILYYKISNTEMMRIPIPEHYFLPLVSLWPSHTKS